MIFCRLVMEKNIVINHFERWLLLLDLLSDRRLQGVLPEEVTILGRYERDMNWTQELNDPVSLWHQYLKTFFKGKMNKWCYWYESWLLHLFNVSTSSCFIILFIYLFSHTIVMTKWNSFSGVRVFLMLFLRFSFFAIIMVQYDSTHIITITTHIVTIV